MNTIDPPKYPVQTVIKAIEIINFLAEESGNRGVGISEFSRELGMGKSTVHRLLDTLQYYEKRGDQLLPAGLEALPRRQDGTCAEPDLQP